MSSGPISGGTLPSAAECIDARRRRWPAMELKIAAREIVRRMTDIRLAIPLEEIEYQPTLATHTISNLRLAFSRTQ